MCINVLLMSLNQLFRRNGGGRGHNRGHFRRAETLCTGVVLCAFLFALVPTPSHADADVTGDDAQDTYRGTGALLLPRSWTGEAKARTRIAHCNGCRWVVQSSCHRQEVGCNMGAWPACPAGMARFDVLFAEDKTTQPTFRGTACIGPHGPVTRHTAQARADALVVRALPALRPRAVCSLPIRAIPCGFVTGSPSRVVLPMQIFDAEVVVTASANYQWLWSDGTRTVTKLPLVRKAFASSGSQHVVLSSTWQAMFTVDGLGPFPVNQSLHQRAEVALFVRNVRAILVE